MKPAFWSDAKVAELSERTRLFYIGLWMIADDAGWFRWDASEVARDLYGYESRSTREKRASRMFEELIEAKRVILHPCGHALIPRMADHQHLAGSTKRVISVFNEHLRETSTAPQSPAETRGNPQSPAPVRLGKERVGEGQERLGQSTARTPDGARLEEPTEFQRRVPRPA